MTRMKMLLLDIQYPLNLLIALIIIIMSFHSFNKSPEPCIETLSKVQI
jgi:hypothetical protein